MAVRLLELEQAIKWPSERISRLVADATKIPIVLDEAKDRGLVHQRVIDRIQPGVGRDDEERQSRTVATAPRIRPRFWVAAVAGTTERVDAGNRRAADDHRHNVVIPAVRVVIGDNDGRALPIAGFHDGIDYGDEVVLLVDRVRVARHVRPETLSPLPD